MSNLHLKVEILALFCTVADFLGDPAPLLSEGLDDRPPPLPPPLSEGLDPPLLYISKTTRTNFFKISSHNLHNV